MKQQVLYRIAKMELAQFATFDENYDSNTTDVQYQFNTNFSFDKEQNMVCNTISFQMLDNEKLLIKADMCSYFALHEQSVEQIRNEKGEIEFAPQLLIQFASLNYGSLRGVLFMKTQGKPLANFILPPMYFNQIIKEPFVVEDK